MEGILTYWLFKERQLLGAEVLWTWILALLPRWVLGILHFSLLTITIHSSDVILTYYTFIYLLGIYLSTRMWPLRMQRHCFVHCCIFSIERCSVKICYMKWMRLCYLKHVVFKSFQKGSRALLPVLVCDATQRLSSYCLSTSSSWVALVVQ